ncbi:hypothetical protein NDU88_008148 [Pleurodeles waltl]|uniref:Uncharacterized protein n=1 Tax=Pleurodeles waltl TaxID=8319 RepID=A0AAV7PTI4_PLEWA|nr:hypothetical protein NDU88_008148 [Pleurodeles waltl]
MSWSGGSKEIGAKVRQPGRGPEAASSGSAETRCHYRVSARPGSGGDISESFLPRPLITTPPCQRADRPPLRLTAGELREARAGKELRETRAPEQR